MRHNPLRDPAVLAEIERKGDMLEQAATAGKMTVELNQKDGRWSLGCVVLAFPRRHEGLTPAAKVVP